jgi:FAD/FMN-containing dehydrogenase
MQEATFVSGIRDKIRGEISCPGDESFDEYRKVWNGMIDRRPSVIVRCAGAADVKHCILFARDHDLSVAVRSGGHSVAGYGVCDGGLMIDLSAMKGIKINKGRRSVDAQAGLTWREFDHETISFGLATTGGVISSTGVAGLTLGGGIGWLMGKFGLACDNLASADVVTADGRFLVASEEENPDLLWALRGGGNFGVVTSLRYQLHPVSIVTGGMILHPFSSARAVFEQLLATTARGLDELTTYFSLMTGHDGSAMCGVALCHCGAISQAEQDLRRLRSFGPPVADMVNPIPYTTLQQMLDFTAPSGLRYYWRAFFVERWTEEALTTLLRWAALKPTPQTIIVLEHVHGAASRIASDETAYGIRRDHWSLNIMASWETADQDESCIAWVRDTSAAMQSFGDGSVYVNYLGDEGDQRVRSAYGDNFAKLKALKTKFDPDNFFRINQNIRPGHALERAGAGPIG